MSALPEFLGQAPDGKPLAELWFGAHPLGPSLLEPSDSPGVPPPATLRELIGSDPDSYLGATTQYAFGNELPFLLKLIAPAQPLSLQVHPTLAQAEVGFAAENATGSDPSDANRNYRDANHKPELLYALTDFEALVGFTVRRRVRERLAGMEEAELAGRLDLRLLLAKGRGVKPVVSWLLDPADGPSPAEVDQFAAECAQRLAAGSSPCPEIDRLVQQLAVTYPGDPGILVAFLMNPVRLSPGEAIYVPPGTLHAYQRGVGVEIMANSDNVVRAGLTPKHVDRLEVIRLGKFAAHPPTRIAPEHPIPGVSRFFAPVDDFELTVTRVQDETLPLMGTGARLILGLAGEVTLMSRANELTLRRGDCVFVPGTEGPVLASGTGELAQGSTP